MNGSIRSLSLAMVAALAFGLGGAAPAFAADSMAAPAMDCSKADGMMMPMKPDAMHDSAMGEMKPSGNVDKDFAQMMMSHQKAMMAMLRAEVACGKDAKTKALAQKQLDQASADNLTLQEILKNDAKI